MKISFVVPGFYKTGGMRVIYEISRGLVDKGHKVTLYSPSIPFNSYKGELSIKSIKHYLWSIKSVYRNKQNSEFFSSGNFDIKEVISINNFTLENADAIIATSWPTAYAVNSLSKSKGNKFYFIQDYETWNSNIKKVNESYKLGLNSITTCTYLQELILKKFNVNSKKIYYGINYDLFNNPVKKYGKVKTISFIHNGLDKKNTPAAIRILSFIKKKYPEIEIVSFGIFSYEGMPEFITSYVNPSETMIRDIYCKSDIFLFTSKEEGFGMPPSEAMACKAAVVSTNVGAIPEYSENGISAFLHDPADEKGITESIDKLIRDENLLKRISDQGYNSVKNKLNWINCVNEFEKHLESFVSTK